MKYLNKLYFSLTLAFSLIQPVNAPAINDSASSMKAQAREQLHPLITKTNESYICLTAKRLDISAVPIFTTLASYAALGLKPTDVIQNIAYPNFTDKDEDLISQYIREDKERESKGIKNPRRNSFTHKVFSSLGSAQIQIYLAARLWSEYINEKRTFSLNDITKTLLTERGSITFLAYEILWHNQIYKEILNLDISKNHIVHWELHRAGNAIYKAKRRLHPSKDLEPMLESPPTRWENICKKY